MSPDGPRPRLVAAAAVVDALAAPSRMLCARRCAPERYAGRWELPGGKVEPGESPEEALRRELAEELGVRVRLGAIVAAPGGGDWPILEGLRMRVWLAELTAGEPRPLQDHDALEWAAAGRLDELDWLGPDVPIVAAIRARLADVGERPTP